MKGNDHEIMKSPFNCRETFSSGQLIVCALFVWVTFQSFRGVRGNGCHSSRAGAEAPTLDIFSVREQRTDLGFYEGKRSWRAFRQS